MNFKVFIPYIIMSIAHVIFCVSGKQLLRKITKCLLLPLLGFGLLFGYCWYLGETRTLIRTDIGTTVALGLFFGWLGDIVLIRANEYKFRMIGSSLFGVGHILYDIAFIARIKDAPGVAVWLICIIVLASVGFFIYTRLSKIIDIDKSMQGSCMMYFILLGVSAALALLCFISGGIGILPFIGYLFFISSDTILVRQWFTVKDPAPKYDFAVMLTYCIAQLLIIVGFVLQSRV